MRIVSLRAFPGPNLHSFSPVVELYVDLEDLNSFSTDRALGFVSALLDLLPGISEHECSLGRRGGFVERLTQGTYPAHVVEHVALELQVLLGADVRFGKTRLVTEPNIYRVVFGCEDPYVGKWAAGAAVELVATLARESMSCPDLRQAPAAAKLALSSALSRGREVFARHSLGPSTRAILDAARRRGIPFIRLNDRSLVQLGYGKYARRIQATLTDVTSCIAADLASDKLIAKKLLAEAGVPVPAGEVAHDEDEAVQRAESIGYPVVVKPFDGNQGKGVSLKLTTPDQVRRAFRLASNYSPSVLVEKYIPGRHYRLLVIGGKMEAASERIPARVVGDGVRSIKELVDLVNADPDRGEGHEKPLTKIRLDPVALMVLAKQNKGLDDVPAPGEVVYIRENANLSTGGTAVDCTDEVHPENARLAVRCAEVIGLDVAGVDAVTEDISRPISEGGGAVIEVNAAPGLRMHLFPARGKSRPVGESVVKWLFPDGAPSRIPIVAVTGTNGKTTTTRMIAHVLRYAGMRVGMACTGGVFVDGEKVMEGDTTGPASARAVLTDRSVEVAVLETARGGIICGGVGFDRCDVAVVTNIGPDHLGSHGVRDLRDLQRVKGLLVELVHRDGCAVLNADDSLVRELGAGCRGEVCYFSRSGATNPHMLEHIRSGGSAVFLCRDEALGLIGEKMARRNGRFAGGATSPDGPRGIRLFNVASIPACFGGRAGFNVENAMAAAAACLSLAIPPETVKAGLETFGAAEADNPGRSQFCSIGGVEVLLDYAHNVPALNAILPLARWRLKPGGRLIAVIACPGDRRDEDMVEMGRVAARWCDFLAIKEDAVTRGRPRGEAARLIQRGALAEGKSPECVKVILPEEEAVREAMAMARPGDMVAVFYEDLALARSALCRHAGRLAAPDEEGGKEEREGLVKAVRPVARAANGGTRISSED